jgi:carboxyl-terminal processing protease
MPRRRRRRPLWPWTALLVLAALVLGIWLGGRQSDALPSFLRSPLVGDEQTRVVRQAIETVHDTYYRTIPEKQLANAAIGGIVASLQDRFSNYFDPKQYAQFKQAQGSEFSGVGISVSQDPRGLRVEEVFDGSPAKRANIVAGDVIVGAAGRSLKGKPEAQSVALIKGRPGTDIRLTILHARRLRRLTLTRSTVTVPVVASRLRTVGGKKIGVVALSTFETSSAHAQVYAALRRLLREGAQGFVLDLRHNGGGLVSEAQLIASAFLRDGPIVSTRGRAVQARTLMATGVPIVPKAPLAVLVDHGTASASEIVTGALQDRHRAVVVGTRTFGKGVFQEVLDLSNGGALDITAGQYFTPSGRNLGGRGVNTGAGITPQVKAQDDPRTKRVDEGLEAALHVVAARIP